MNKNKNKKLGTEKVGKKPLIIAWMSFIPVFGIFFALIAIMMLLSIDGEKEGKKKLSIITAVGFLYSVIVVTIFLYMELQRYTGVVA